MGIMGVAFFVVTLVAFLFLDPETSAVDLQASYYALGEYGWLMRVAFFVLGIATISIALGLRGALASGKRFAAAWVLIVVAGIGFISAGAFNSDPPDVVDMTATGTAHGIASLVAMLSLIVSAWLLRGVFKRDSLWQDISTSELWFAIALTATFLVASSNPEGDLSGLTQRIFIAVMMAWLAFLGWQVRKRPTTHDSHTGATSRP